MSFSVLFSGSFNSSTFSGRDHSRMFIPQILVAKSSCGRLLILQLEKFAYWQVFIFKFSSLGITLFNRNSLPLSNWFKPVTSLQIFLLLQIMSFNKSHFYTSSWISSCSSILLKFRKTMLEQYTFSEHVAALILLYQTEPFNIIGISFHFFSDFAEVADAHSDDMTVMSSKFL